MIPDRSATALSLQLSEEIFAQILAISADAIVCVDDSHRIVLFNQGAERIFGWSAADVIGRPLDVLLPHAFVEIHRRHLESFAASDVAARRMGERGEVTGLRRDGSTFPGEASISKLRVADRMLFTAVMRDVTERREAEKEMARLLVREQAARAAAQAAVNARDDVLGVVSHDLRNPLSAIAMCASSLLEGNAGHLPAAAADLAQTIRQSSDWMNRLIQDLLDVSSIEAGRLALERRPVDPTRLVVEATVMLEPIARERAITLREELPDELPRVDADPERVVQVLSNLVGNALKFTPRGGEVVVRAMAESGAVRFAVADSGVGIPADHLPHIFDRYWQARKGAARAGAGLGLAISRGIVEAHGGRIAVETREGKGTTFTFALPLAEGARGE